jgi:hypothetical protein
MNKAKRLRRQGGKVPRHRGTPSAGKKSDTLMVVVPDSIEVIIEQR